LKTAKVAVVSRYLSYVNSLTTKKIIYKPEYDHLLGLGIGVHLNYEWYTGRCAEGYASGKIDGQIALGQAKTLNYPQGWPITFSDDQSTTPLSALDSYLHGANDGLAGNYFAVGNYAPVDKLDAMLRNGRAVFGWEPTAWSGGRISALAHLFQHYGGAPISGTDLNTIL
jgi:hypothetical protein